MGAHFFFQGRLNKCGHEKGKEKKRGENETETQAVEASYLSLSSSSSFLHHSPADHFSKKSLKSTSFPSSIILLPPATPVGCLEPGALYRDRHLLESKNIVFFFSFSLFYFPSSQPKRACICLFYGRTRNCRVAFSPAPREKN